MKKMMFGFVALLVATSLCGCQYTRNPSNLPDSSNVENENITTNDESASENKTTEEQLDFMDDTADSGVFKTVAAIYDYESVTGLDLSDSIDFGYSVFDNSLVSPTKTLKILDREYDLTYLESAKLSMTAAKVNTYSVNGADAKVIFDEKNERIVEYINIPLKISYETEQEYVEFIRQMVKDDADLSEYEYMCTTWYFVYYDNGVESVVDDGFRKCGENERLAGYSFYFDKYVNGMKTLDHVSAEFDSDSFSLEIYNSGYTDETFSKFNAEVWDDVQKDIVEYLNSHLIFDSKLDAYRIVDQRLFIRDGKQYCQTIVEVDVSNDDFGVITSRQQLISGWFASENKQ